MHGVDQKSVDMRHVVGHQQRRAAERNVLLADDADLEQCVRRQPQQEAHQELRHHAHDVNRRNQRHDAEDQHQLVGGETCSLSCNPHSAADASSNPMVLWKLLVAMMRPFSWLSLRCCR